jgi:hypothetical protein
VARCPSDFEPPLRALDKAAAVAIAIAACSAGVGSSGTIADAAKLVSGSPESKLSGASTTMWLSIFLMTAAISLCLCLAAVILQAEGDAESRSP